MKKLRSFPLVSPLFNFPLHLSAVILFSVVLAFLGQYIDNRCSNPIMPSLSAFSVLFLLTPWISRYIYKSFTSLRNIIDSITESSQQELFVRYEHFIFGINKWSVIVIIVLAFCAEFTDAIVWGIRFGFAGITYYLLMGVLFGILGSLGWAYWGILLFALRLNRLQLDLEPFETKRDEFDKLSSCFLNIIIAGITLYLGGIAAGWFALGPYILSISALKYWIFPLAIMVIVFVIAIQFSLHNLMKKAQNSRINKIMLLASKYYRECEQALSPERVSLINDLLIWKEKIERESSRPYDIMTILSLLATIVLPAVKSIVELF